VATRKHMIDLSNELSITVLKISEEVIADQIITL